MKTLYLCRHSKSSWKDLTLSDFERPLNKRGKNDAPLMGKVLRDKKVKPDLILSSPAVRAFKTAKKYSKYLSYPEENIKTDLRLYESDWRDLLYVLRETEDKISDVMLFGHNPGLTDLCNQLMDSEDNIENIPTSGIAALQIDNFSWTTLEPNSCSLLFFEYPKMYK